MTCSTSRRPSTDSRRPPTARTTRRSSRRSRRASASSRMSIPWRRSPTSSARSGPSSSGGRTDPPSSFPAARSSSPPAPRRTSRTAGPLPAVRDVRRGAGGDEERAAGKLDGGSVLPPEDDGPERAELVGDRLHGIDILDEADALLERLDDLLVVQAVGGRLLHRAPVGDVRTAPELHELREVRRLAGALRPRALRADGLPVPELADEQPAFLGGEPGENRGLSLRAGERRESVEGLLDVERVIGLRFGGGVDRRQASADDEDRQVDVQVRERVFLEGARELERHEKVGGLPHAADEVVLHRDERRLPGARRDRDVVESEIEGLLVR